MLPAPFGWLGPKGTIQDVYSPSESSRRAHSHCAGALRTWQKNLVAANVCSAAIEAAFADRLPSEAVSAVEILSLAQKLLPGAQANDVAFLEGLFEADGSDRCVTICQVTSPALECSLASAQFHVLVDTVGKSEWTIRATVPTS
jgi:hypothetical protein